MGPRQHTSKSKPGTSLRENTQSPMTCWSLGNQSEEISAVLPSTVNLEPTSHVGKRDSSSSSSGILISGFSCGPDSVAAELMGAQPLSARSAFSHFIWAQWSLEGLWINSSVINIFYSLSNACNSFKPLWLLLYLMPITLQWSSYSCSFNEVLKMSPSLTRCNQLNSLSKSITDYQILGCFLYTQLINPERY